MANRDPLVTVYIVSHNYGKYLTQSIKSVINQTYKNWELIIVNDNSKDETYKIAKKFLKQNRKIISLINYKRTKGLQRIANKVLSICNGEYIIRLDADDWLDENALIILINKAKKNKNIGAVFGNYFLANEKGKIIGFDREINNDNFEKNKFVAPHGACTLFKTSELKKIGGYSEDINSQDGWEAWYKLKEKNLIKSVNNIIFYYRQHKESVSKNRNLIKSRNKILEKLSKASFGNYRLKSLAIIPVKENYEDIKNIPFLKYKNVNLIDRTLQSVMLSNVDNIVVATSSNKLIKYIKKKYKNKIITIKRTQKLEKSISSIEDILIYCTKKFKLKKKIIPDIILFLSIHTIRFDHDHINRSIDLIKLNKFDTIYSATKEVNPTFKFDGSKYTLLNKGRFNNLDYLSQRILKFNGSVITTWWKVLESKKMLNNNFGIIELNENDVLQVNNLKRTFEK